MRRLNCCPTISASTTAALRRRRFGGLLGGLLGGLQCSLLAGALALPMATHVWAAAPTFPFVTEDEAQREARAAGAAASAPAPTSLVPRSRGVPLPPAPGAAPVIDVVAPAGEATVISPLRLEVNFRSAPDARIVPNSFRVLYGLLKIDLTERLQSRALFSERGVVVEGAQMPQGTHRLLLRVADDRGRVAEQAVVFHVASRP